MNLTGVCLVTKDVPGLVRYYEAVLGCKAEGDDTHAEFSFNGLGMAIFSKAAMEAMAAGCMQGAGAGSMTLMFEVADVDAEYERLKTLQVEIVKPPESYPWGSRAVWFRDPDGNIVDFWAKVKA